MRITGDKHLCYFIFQLAVASPSIPELQTAPAPQIGVVLFVALSPRQKPRLSVDLFSLFTKASRLA